MWSSVRRTYKNQITIMTKKGKIPKKSWVHIHNKYTCVSELCECACAHTYSHLLLAISGLFKQSFWLTSFNNSSASATSSSLLNHSPVFRNSACIILAMKISNENKGSN